MAKPNLINMIIVMNYWIMKTEPDVFSIDDLKSAPNSTSCWDGVRNYQARNFMRDQMRKNDKVLIYHSSCKNIGIVGLGVITKEAYPDHTSWDPKSDSFDPNSTKNAPRWFMVDVKWLKTFNKTITLSKLKQLKEFNDSPLIKKGNRLSIIPTSKEQFEAVLRL